MRPRSIHLASFVRAACMVLATGVPAIVAACYVVGPCVAFVPATTGRPPFRCEVGDGAIWVQWRDPPVAWIGFQQRFGSPTAGWHCTVTWDRPRVANWCWVPQFGEQLDPFWEGGLWNSPAPPGRYAIIPLWPLLVPPLGWWTMILWRRRRKRRRARVGLCPRCGYDLRASTGTCPECGTPMPTAHVR